MKKRFFIIAMCLLNGSAFAKAEEYFEPIIKSERKVLKQLIQEIGFKETDVRIYKTISELKFVQGKSFGIKSQVLYRKKTNNGYEWKESKREKKYAYLSVLPKYPNVAINSSGHIIAFNIEKNKITFENSQYLNYFKELLVFSIDSKNGCTNKAINNFKKSKIKYLFLSCSQNISFPNLEMFPELESLYMRDVDLKNVSIPEKNSLKHLLIVVDKNIQNLHEFKNLNNLKRLRLTLPRNDLGYHVDLDWFSKMTQLKHLKIHKNKTVNEFSSLDDLKNLRYLSLTLDSIQELPELSHLTNLKYLYLEMHQVKSLPDLSKLTALEFMQLKMHSLRKLPAFKYMKNLVELEVKETQLTSLDFLEKTISLEKLNIFRAPVKSMIPIESLVNLTEVRFSQTGINKIQGLEKLNKLKSFAVVESPVTKMEGLDHLSSLEELNLIHLKIDKLENMEKLLNLKTFLIPKVKRTKENRDYLKALEERDVLVVY